MLSIRTRFDARAAAALALCASAALVAPIGCRTAPPDPIPAANGDDAPPRRGGTLRLASFADIRGLDPASSSDGLSLAAIDLLFSGLVGYNARARPVPELAERWEVEDGGRTYRFFLRPGVAMQDGSELTADDVERSVERALHPTTPNPNASYFAGIVGYDAYAARKAEHLAGVVVEGRYVVSFHLVRPDATFLYLLAMRTLRPTCKSAGRRYSDTWRPCGAGPFKLEPGGWQRGMRLRLVRFDGYFRPGLPYLDAIEWTYGMPNVAQRTRFERGELDVFAEPTEADLSRYAGDPRWRGLALRQPDTMTFGESMNTRMPPFDNVEIRRAVAAAINREHYRMVQPRRITILHQALPGIAADLGVPLVGQRYDYQAALEHMRRAGYPYDPATGRGGWPRPIEYLLYDQGVGVLTAQILQQELAQIGLRIEFKLVSWPAFLTLQQRANASAMSLGNNQMDYPDPSSVFEPLFTTASISAESSYNTAFFSNSELDGLVARAHQELDAVVRKTLYRQADQILCDEAPWAFTFSFHYVQIRQPYVRGYLARPVWSQDVSRVWLDRTADRLGRLLGGGTP